MTQSSALWEAVLRLTSEQDLVECRPVRIPLFLLAMNPRSRPFIHPMKDLARLCMSLPIWTRHKPRNDVSAGGVLFGFFHPTAANMNNLLPVFNEARKSGVNALVIFANATACSSFLKGDQTVPRISLRDLIRCNPLSSWPKVIWTSLVLTARLRTRAQRIESRLAECIRKESLQILVHLISARLCEEGMCRLIDSWRPSALVSTSDFWPVEHACFKVIRDRGLSSFVVQHGVPCNYWWPCVSEEILVWGSRFSETLHQYGVPLSSMVVCGMPASDNLFSKPNRASRVEKMAASGKLSILLLSHTHTRRHKHHAHIYQTYASWLTQVMSSVPNVRWLVKLHPSEDSSFYTELESTGKISFDVLPKSMTLEESFARADVAATLFSTAGLEAMMASLPVIVLDVSAEIQEFAWWPRHGGGVMVSSPENLAEVVQHLQQPGFREGITTKQQKFLERAFAHHGRSAATVVKHIRESLSQRRERCLPATQSDAIKGT